ncbi:MAG: DUF898 family protein, partial [Desulfarculaceae bacterium]
AYRKQKKFLAEHHHYGSQPFAFSARNKDYYKIFFLYFVLVMAGLGLTYAFFRSPLGLLFSDPAVFDSPIMTVLLLLIFYLFFFFFASAYFLVETVNLFYNSSSLGGHTFEADLELKGYLWLIVSNTLLTALTLGFFHPWAAVRSQRYLVNHLHLIPGGSLDDFVAQEQSAVSALGDEAAEFLDLDLGL